MSGARKRRAYRSLQSASRAMIESLEERQMLTLTVDVTGAGGPGNSSAQVSFVGQVLNLQIWAVITDPQNLPSEDGVQDVDGSILGTNVGPGPVAGNLAAAILSPFDSNGSQNGTSQDLNGDGNLDVGSNNGAVIDNFFFARSGGVETATNQNIVGDAAEFEIGTLTYTVTNVNFGGETDINFRFRDAAAAGVSEADGVWREDNQGISDFGSDGVVASGAPFVVTSPGNEPDPTAVNDSASTNLNTPVTVHVLANDPAIYTPNDPSSVVIVSPPTEGTASVNSDGTVLYIPDNGFIGSDSFTYTVNDTNGKTSNAATVDVNTGLEISSAKGGDKSVTYTDADGTVATISLNLGNADLAFTGNGSATTKNGKVTIGGTQAITGVTLSGTSKASVLTITGKGGDGAVSIDSISDSAIMGKINAPILDLTGSSPSTLAGLSSLQVKQLNGATLTISGSAPLTITAPTITGTSISAPTSTVSLSAGSVTNTTVSALSDKTIHVTGAVTSTTLSNTSTAVAGQLVFGGDVNSSTLASGGAFKNLSAASITDSTITSGPISSLHVKGAVSASSIQLNGNTSGPIRVVVGGNLGGSTITTAGALTSLSAGTISTTNITTAGDILALSTSSLSGSTILAGTNNSGPAVTLDNVTAGNVGANQIRSIKVSKTFSDSTVIAQTIGSASLGEVSNAGNTPTGLGAQVYKSTKLSVNGTALNLTSKQLAILTALQDELAAKDVPVTSAVTTAGTPALLLGTADGTFSDAIVTLEFVAING
jgi:Bacterial Ig domain